MVLPGTLPPGARQDVPRIPAHGLHLSGALDEATLATGSFNRPSRGLAN